MSTVVHDQELDTTIVSRAVLIDNLRAALNAAEAGDDVVQIYVGNVEVAADFDSGELIVYA